MAGKHIQSKTEEERVAHTSVHGRKKKQVGKKKALWIALGCIAVVAVLVVGLWKMLIAPPDVSHNVRPGGGSQTAGVNGDTEEGDEPITAGGRKDGYYTFLLLGKDTSSGSTDTIILVSYDVPNQQVNMMSIPRDTAVNVPWSIKKVNSVYSAKESSGGGLENLKKQVSYLTGVMPDFYVLIEWEAVGELVNALGGVEFDVPRNMNYDDPYQDLHIHLEKGLQVLNGEEAMGVIRYRHDNRRADGVMPGYADGDLGRTKTQQAFLKACVKQALKLENVGKVKEFVEIFMKHVETDLPLQNLIWFATQAMGMDADTIQSCTMPNTPVSFHGGSYVLPDGEEIITVVNEQFNPYDRDITADDLQIMVRNKDGSVYITNGTLLDSRWGKATSSGSSSSSGSSGSSSSSGGQTTTNPPTEETTDPNTGETTDPGTGGTTDPGTGETTDPGTGETTDPGTGETTDPGTGETTDPGTGETTDPGTGGTTDPGTGGTTDPGTGGVTDPGTGGTTDPGTGGTTDPGTSVPDDTVPPGWLSSNG